MNFFQQSQDLFIFHQKICARNFNLEERYLFAFLCLCRDVITLLLSELIQNFVKIRSCQLFFILLLGHITATFTYLFLDVTFLGGNFFSSSISWEWQLLSCLWSFFILMSSFILFNYFMDDNLRFSYIQIAIGSYHLRL